MLFEQYQILFVFYRGPKLWIKFLNTDEKHIGSYNLFSRKVKSKLLDTENNVRYFKISQKLLFQINLDFWIYADTILWGCSCRRVFLGFCAVNLWHPSWGVTSTKLHGGFVGVAPQWGCSTLFIYTYICIYIYIFPSTHLKHLHISPSTYLKHLLCVLKH